MEPSKPTASKTKMSSFKKIILIILAFLLLSFILQKSGLKVLNVTEEDAVIERPHQ